MERNKKLSPKVEDLVVGNEYYYFNNCITDDEYLIVKYSHFDGKYYVFTYEGDGKIDIEFSELGIKEFIEDI